MPKRTASQRDSRKRGRDAAPDARKAKAAKADAAAAGDRDSDWVLVDDADHAVARINKAVPAFQRDGTVQGAAIVPGAVAAGGRYTLVVYLGLLDSDRACAYTQGVLDLAPALAKLGCDLSVVTTANLFELLRLAEGSVFKVGAETRLVPDQDLTIGTFFEVVHGTVAAFVIGKEGTLRHAVRSQSVQGLCAPELLRMVAGFHHHDRHGDHCPANWTEGAPAFKPTIEGYKAFAEAQL